MKQNIDIINTGTKVTPIWQVWLNPEDENGICIEHECEFLANFLTKEQAMNFIKTL